ncbi:MAG TPA: hypothetical protein VMA77_10835 [Solirubrobacteraceae bacterium]|jgi:hypothetical protein|nr:hypothetical protein [Solirubrobacteraceae bacterium]
MSLLAEGAPRAPSGGLGRLVVHVFGLLFLVLIGLSILTNLLVAPVVVSPCASGQPCGAPPTVPAVIRETGWRSSRYGFTLEYPASVVKVSQQTPSGVVLAVNLSGKGGAVTVEGFGPGTTPAEAISHQVGALGGVSQLAADKNPAHQLLGAGVGYLAGAGRTYVGDATSPQGSQPVSIASQAASDGRVTVSATVVGATSDSGYRSDLYAVADLIINSVRWHG